MTACLLRSTRLENGGCYLRTTTGPAIFEGPLQIPCLGGTKISIIPMAGPRVDATLGFNWHLHANVSFPDTIWHPVAYLCHLQALPCTLVSPSLTFQEPVLQTVIFLPGTRDSVSSVLFFGVHAPPTERPRLEPSGVRPVRLERDLPVFATVTLPKRKGTVFT